jgi:hypothetical protein
LVFHGLKKSMKVSPSVVEKLRRILQQERLSQPPPPSPGLHVLLRLV